MPFGFATRAFCGRYRLQKGIERFALLGVSLTVAGCQASPDLGQATASLPPKSISAPAVINSPQPAVAMTAPRKPIPRPIPVAPHPSPDVPLPQLVGMDERQLTNLLGVPTSEDSTGPGKHWYYRLHHCALNLSLYPSVNTRTFHLLSYEVSDDDVHGDPKRHCQAELAERLHAHSQQARSD